jgi:type II secretory pathway component PulM
MLAWFKQFQPLQQVSVVTAVVLIAVLFYFQVLLLPLTDTLQEKQQQYEAARQEQQVVTNYAQEILALQNAGQSRSTLAIGNLTSLVNSTLQARQLQLTRIQQLTPEQVSIRLENVDFANALTWLYELESTPGLVVGDIGIRPLSTTQAGLVNVSVELRRQE